jgi:hypothetical protein
MTYEVRFTCYQYNGGGNIRNGAVHCKEVFTELKKAQDFAEQVSEAIGDRTWATERNYVWDGYVDQFNGIYRVVEERV